MAQQAGAKRARKVLKRKQSQAREARKTNIKQAIYAFEKAMKAQGAEAHEHSDKCEHEGHKHD